MNPKIKPKASLHFVRFEDFSRLHSVFLFFIMSKGKITRKSGEGNPEKENPSSQPYLQQTQEDCLYKDDEKKFGAQYLQERRRYGF